MATTRLFWVQHAPDAPGTLRKRCTVPSICSTAGFPVLNGCASVIASQSVSAALQGTVRGTTLSLTTRTRNMHHFFSPLSLCVSEL